MRNRLTNLQDTSNRTGGTKSSVTTPIKPFQQAGGTNQASAITQVLARKQTRVVNVLRVCVLSVLIVTAALVSTAVYLYTRNQERSSFAADYEDSAHQVIESFHEAVERNMAAVASLSNSITSYAIQSNHKYRSCAQRIDTRCTSAIYAISSVHRCSRS